MKILLCIFAILTQLPVFATVNLLQDKAIKDGWIAYKIPAQNNTNSMCCWNQKGASFIVNGNSNNGFESCDLNSEPNGYGSSNHSPITANINIYAKIKNGEVKQLLSVGDSCQVKTSGHKITRLNSITQTDSLAFLVNTAKNAKKAIAHNALYAISHHKSEKASKNLYEIALENKATISKNAVFWLGEERNDGVKYLKKLYQQLPSGKARHHINFALAQADNEQSIILLKSIAKTDDDPEQRSDALFWLSQNEVEGIVAFLVNVIESDRSNKVQEKAVFSLSQIETKEASDALLTLAETHKRQNIREKALFWLVEINPAKAKQIVLNILKSNKNKQTQDDAVFTLSRIDEESEGDALFELISGDYSQAIKKKALFWLAQSENPKVIDRLQMML